MKHLSPLIAAGIPVALISFQLIAKEIETKEKSAVVLGSEVNWGALNPARGEMGPRAADLWGDRTASGATGFLVKFKDGFSSPPHIHNVTYRGLVISGLVHNDDPDAAEMWMPPGSFWIQPAGEVHITAAKGEEVVAYIEIQEGPYLVQPKEEASDNGERPVNIDPSNFVWLHASNSPWIDPAAENVEITYLWGNPQDNKPMGTLVKLPANFDGSIESTDSELQAVVIKGNPKHQRTGATIAQTLKPGSYFGSSAATKHRLSTGDEEECLIYLRTGQGFNVTAASESHNSPD